MLRVLDELHALAELEEDALLRRAFARGLYVNGMAVAPFLSGYQAYRNEDDAPFDPNWRRIAPLWKAQDTVQAAVDLARPQCEYWMAQVVPRKKIENAHVRQVLYVNWIAQLSGHTPLRRRASDALDAMLCAVQWDTLHLPDAFVAECAYWAGKKQAPRSGGGETDKP